jgi:hypothetical protein
MLSNYRSLIENILLSVAFFSLLAAVPNLLLLQQPIDLESQTIENYTGTLHVFYTQGRFSQQRLEVLSPKGKQLASISCDLLAEPCYSFEGQGISTVSAVSSMQGHVIPLKIQREDKTIVLAEEPQLKYLESERLSQLSVIYLSCSSFLMSIALWTFLRTRLWPGAPLL